MLELSEEIISSRGNDFTRRTTFFVENVPSEIEELLKTNSEFDSSFGHADKESKLFYNYLYTKGEDGERVFAHEFVEKPILPFLVKERKSITIFVRPY